MKWWIVFVAMPGVGLAQFGNVDESVRALMTSGMVTGSEAKPLSRTGDPAAAALTRYIAGMRLDARAVKLPDGRRVFAGSSNPDAKE